MDNLNDHKRRASTFKSEALKLKQLNYINDDTFNTIKQAYDEYDYDYSQQLIQEASHQLSNNISPQKPKPVVSPEQIRERNISIIMIVGVILLLLGGVILATSTWDIMSSLMKTMLIFMVCFLFYGISIVSETVLKIHKTSYAFLSLSALFLPISILSAAYFELFGSWLSFYGGGRYVLGILGSIICTALYAANAFKLNSKLFMWFTMVADTVTMMFIVLQIKSTREIFFLGMILYCSLLILLYHKIKDNSKLSLLSKELVKYIPIVTSFFTVLLLTLSPNCTLNGINIMLSAIVFLSLTLVTKQRNYSYIFSALMAYGMFKFIHFDFKSIELLLFSLMGLFFLAMERIYRKEEFLDKLFGVISVIVALATFFIITIFAVMNSYEHEYLILLISYMLLFINMSYVSYSIKSKILSYAASLFLMVAGYYSYLLINTSYPIYKILRDHSNMFGIYMFILSAIIFFFLYYKNHYKYTLHLKTSSMATSLVMMYICMASAGIGNRHIKLGLEAIILSLLLFLLLKRMKEEFEIKTLLYLILFNITLIVSSLVSFNTHIIIGSENIMVLTSYIIFILWFFSKGIWKDRISYYFIIFGVCSQYQFTLIYTFGTTELLKVVILAVTALYVIHKRSWSMFNLIPLVSLIYAINRFTDGLTIPNHETITMLILAAVLIIFKSASEMLSKDLYIIKNREVTFIDFYFPAALFMCPIIWKNSYNMSLIYRLIPGLLLVYLLSSQVKRASNNLIKSIILSLSIVSSLIPYYLLIGEYMTHSSFYYCIASYVPWVILAELIINNAWKNDKKIAYKVQWLILGFVSLRLLIAVDSTYTAIILGILSILSIIVSMQYRIRCYFFVGIATLAFNILIQTKPFWGSIPWWAYLIISGFILIGLASFNEWQKKNEKKLLKDKLDKFKDWL